MEWVETTARTVIEAKELALDQLGVAEDDADFEILDEPKSGLFGRVRGEARVRARVRPTQARQKVERRERRPKADKVDKAEKADRVDKAVHTANAATATADATAATIAGTTTAAPVLSGAGQQRSEGTASPTAARQRQQSARPARTAGRSADASNDAARPSYEAKANDVTAQQVGHEAQLFIDQLVTAFGLSGTSELVEAGDDIEVHVHGADLGLLVGPRGTTLQAIQDLTRVASQRRLNDHDTRLRVDIAGYRQKRSEALRRFALQVAEDVTSSGTARLLEPMSSADRKVIHDSLSDVAGIATRSEGEDPNRRVVVAPANG